MMNDEINIKIPGQILDYVDTKEHLLDLFNYITNLQQKIKHYEETTTFGDYVKEVNLLVDYKSRCEKEVEYIEEHIKYECDDAFNGMQFYSYHLYDFSKDDLLNILNGRSDE